MADAEQPKSTILFCTDEHIGPVKEPYYDHFYPHPGVVRMCGVKRVFKVLVEEDQSGSEDPYWGWWDNDKQMFLFVYRKQMLLNMCFPYGPEVQERRGDGIRLPVKITVLEAA
jgi:hypothetical protein